MKVHKIGFYGEIWKIIPKLSQLPFLIWNTELTPIEKNGKNENGGVAYMKVTYIYNAVCKYFWFCKCYNQNFRAPDKKGY